MWHEGFFNVHVTIRSGSKRYLWLLSLSDNLFGQISWLIPDE